MKVYILYGKPRHAVEAAGTQHLVRLCTFTLPLNTPSMTEGIELGRLDRVVQEEFTRWVKNILSLWTGEAFIQQILSVMVEV